MQVGTILDLHTAASQEPPLLPFFLILFTGYFSRQLANRRALV